MSGSPIDDSKRMELAIQIAVAACALDHLKNIYPTPAEREEAELHANKLHDIAEFLAGSRVLELYGPDIEEETRA